MTDFYKKNDNLLRDKLTQHEFAQTPNAWENMSALLDQHPVVAKRAVGYWWSVPFVTAAALAGVIGLGVYFAPNQTRAAASNNIIAQQTATESVTLQAPKVAKQFTQSSAPSQELKDPIVEIKQNKAAATTVTAKKATVKKKEVVKGSLLTAEGSKKDSKNPAILSVSNVSTPIATTQAVENTNLATTSSTDNKKEQDLTPTKRRVKTTRTQIIYQYSTTPLRALQEKRRLMEKQNTIGNFGIGDELSTKKSPLKASVFGGASAKVYGSTKDFSVMPFAGVSASYRIAKHHGIQAGVQYKSIGNVTQNSNAQLEPNNRYGNTATIKRIDLLEVPLVYQFHPHPKYNIQTGVKGAWLMNTETTDPELNNLTNKEMGISDFDFSLLLGMEYCFNDHWAVGVQYSLGLINLTKDASDMHQEEIQATIDAGNDPQYNIQSLDNSGELVVPVSTDNIQTQSMKVPNQFRNNDVQLLLKYTF